MGLQPSASKTEILLRCPRPFEEEVETEPDLPEEPARYGSAFHQIIAACLRSGKKTPLEKNNARYAREVDRAARKHDVKDFAHELAAHVKGSVKYFRKWLTLEKLEIIAIEKAYAVYAHGSEWSARQIEPHDENHVYDVKSGELPGTVDVIAASNNRRRILPIDHKTGMFEDWFLGEGNVRFALPTTVAQLRTLGLAATAHVPKRGADVEVAIFHADRRGLPILYSEPYELEDQKRHARALWTSFARIGQGFLRPGSYCRRCPVRASCPARAAALLVESAEVLTAAANKVALEPIEPLYVLPTDEPPPGTLETRAGALYDMLKRFRELEKAGTEELRRLVRGGAVIETRDGKVLTLRKQTYETLSKKGVIQALGKIAGERELERLRKKGLITESTREMLVAEE